MARCSCTLPGSLVLRGHTSHCDTDSGLSVTACYPASSRFACRALYLRRSDGGRGRHCYADSNADSVRESLQESEAPHSSLPRLSLLCLHLHALLSVQLHVVQPYPFNQPATRLNMNASLDLERVYGSLRSLRHFHFREADKVDGPCIMLIENAATPERMKYNPAELCNLLQCGSNAPEIQVHESVLAFMNTTATLSKRVSSHIVIRATVSLSL